MSRSMVLRDTQVFPIYLPAVIIRLLEERGLNGEGGLAGTGLQRRQIDHHETLITLNQVQQIFENAWRLSGDPVLGLELGKRLRLPRLGTLGAAAMAAPTVRDLLNLFKRFYPLLGPAWAFDWGQEGDEVRIQVRRTLPLGNTARFRTDAWLIAFARNLVTLLEDARISGRLEFDYGEPDDANALAHCQQAAAPLAVRFHCTEPQVIVSCPDLDALLPNGSPAAFGEALARCDHLLAQRALHEDLLTKVTRLVRHASPAPVLSQLARDCCMSERTLERRLSEFGMSYRQVVDDCRKDRALALVGDTTVPLDAVAEMLGYADTSSFGKSFKRWTGYSPAAYRTLAV